MTPGTDEGAVRGWRQWMGRPLMDVSIAMLIAALLSDLREAKRMFVDPDLWWHIANGRFVEQMHAFVRVEPYSFTVAGQPWIDPEWLAGLVYWLGYKHAGLSGIVAVAAVAILGNVALVYARSRRESGSGTAALWTTVLAILLMTVNTSARMILFGYLGLGLEMLLLERARRGESKGLWLLPAVFAVWVNVHGSWAIGMAVLVLYAVCGWRPVHRGVFAQEGFTGAERRRLLAVVAASAAALLVNPYGWRLVWNPFDMQFGQRLNLANVQEWQPLNLGTFVGLAAVLALLVLLAANALKQRTWTVFEMALLVFAWYEAVAHVRFTFLAAVLTMPMITADAARAFLGGRREMKMEPWMGAVAAGGVAVVMAAVLLQPEAKLEAAFAEEMPLKTVAALRPEWRVLNQDNYGGWMDFNGKPTFLDSRFDTFEHHGVMKDFLDTFEGNDSLRLMEKYGVDHVLAKADAPLVYLLEQMPGWRVAMREGTGKEACVLLERTAGR